MIVEFETVVWTISSDPNMAFKLLFIALCIFVPSSLSQCTVEKALPFFKRSVYEFSLELVTRIAQETENHFISSAFSPWSLLSAMSLGAAEQTLDEIEKVLRMHPHKCFNKKFFEIIQQLQSSDGVTLERSSSIFADERMVIKDVFLNRIKDTKVCNAQTLPFYNFDEVAKRINEYVSAATHETITEVIEPSDLEGVLMVVIDALYFKGSWQNKFSAEDTEFSAFYDERGNQIGDVNLMFAEQEANYLEIPEIEASVLELPYGQSGRFSMILILPKSGSTISSVLTNLKKISLSTIYTLFAQTGKQQVLVQIPRFKVNSDLDNMKEWLTDMGLRAMFDSTLAKFPDISDYSLYVSDFIQKATIEVTEEGTEASAVTVELVSGRSLNAGGAQFTANKPFLFMITDRQLELALFTGAYSKPEVY